LIKNLDKPLKRLEEKKEVIINPDRIPKNNVREKEVIL